jgi:hypothetical protein
MGDHDWQPFEECERYITQRNAAGEHRWCHRYEWHKDGRLTGYGADGDLSSADLAAPPWREGMAPGHGQPRAS